MCDYSLMHFPNRLAVEGEELIAYRFPSGSTGLASAAEFHKTKRCEASTHQSFWAALKNFFKPAEEGSVTAVCIPPSARLLLHNVSQRFQREYGVRSEEEGTFEQISAAANTYRDAVRFQNGRLVRLQELPEGQQITVISLSILESPAPSVETETLPVAS